MAGKGEDAERRDHLKSDLGHTVKSRMTVIRISDGALSDQYIARILFAGALCAGVSIFDTDSQDSHDTDGGEKHVNF